VNKLAIYVNVHLATYLETFHSTYFLFLSSTFKQALLHITLKQSKNIPPGNKSHFLIKKETFMQGMGSFGN